VDAVRRLVGLLVAALVATLALVACTPSGPSDPASNANQAPTDVQLIRPKAAFTARTISDWKSLGDAIVIAEVTSSREDDSTLTEAGNTGGIYGRVVTVAVLNRLWVRDAMHTPPAQFDMDAWGWVQRGNVKQAIVAAGEPRLETNHVYLLALARFTTGWSTLGDGAEMPFDNGTAGQGEWAGKVNDADQPALADLMGKNAAQVAAIIAAAQPDPRSVTLGSLDPLSRAKKLGKTSG
jgi:hypothetical protein